jgi:zinc transport system substrate-binding protein
MHHGTKTLWLFLLLFGGVIALLFLVAVPKAARHTGPSVAVTAYPLYDITRRLADGVTDVQILLPPGANPHTFEPLPSTRRAVESAEAVYAIGHGFDDWSVPLLAGTSVDKVVIDRDIALRKTQDADEPGDGSDPHYWLTVPNARRIAVTIADDLQARFPDKAGRIRGNLATYDRELQDADARIRKIISGIRNRDLVTLHDAWYYFAEAYGLHIVGTFEPTAGREPTPQYLAELSEAVRRVGAETLYSEPFLPLNGLEQFLKDEGLTVTELDPLEGTSTASYAATLTRNAEIIRDHQQ